MFAALRTALGRGTPDAPPPRTCERVLVTSVLDGAAHIVTERELSSPDALRAGRYSALCGHEVAPAPLCAPDGARCAECVTVHRATRPSDG